MYEDIDLALDTYDPMLDTFDPEYNNYDGQRRKGASGSIDITISNDIAEAVNIQLFAPLFNDAEFKRAPVTGEATYSPAELTLAQRFDPTAQVSTSTQTKVVYFDNIGNLVYEMYTGVGTFKRCTISCRQIPFKSLLKSTESTPFSVSRARMSFVTDAQISNNLNFFTKTFLGGTIQNPVNPRTYFNPMQNQGLTVDVQLQGAQLYGEKGIWYTLNPPVSSVTNKVDMNLTIAKFEKTGKL